MKIEVTKGSIFDEIADDPGEAAQLKIKAALFSVLIRYIEDNELTQEEAAKRMGVQRSRVGDISRGKISGFTIDYLVAMAARVGLEPFKIAA